MREKYLGLLTLVLLFAIFWQWWLPGPRVAIDFPVVLDGVLASQIDLPRVWSEKDVEGLGEYSVFTLWSYPATLISAILAKFGLGFAIQERVLWVMPFLLLGTFGIWKLCKDMNLSNYAKSVASLLYLANTYILLVIDGGQLSIALAYALLPLSFLLLKNSINAPLQKRIIAGLSVCIIGIFDVRVIFILFLLTSIYFLYWMVFNPKGRIKWIKGWIKTGVVCALSLITLNAYWLFPYIFNPVPTATFQKLTQTNFQVFSNLGHGMLLIAPHWYKNVFGNIAQLSIIFFLIPLLVFLAPILKPRNKIVGFWILIALISVFLAKGADEPFPQAYIWLFSNIPGFSLFRDSSKFFFLIALSFSLLLAVTTDEILKRINRFAKLKIVFFTTLIVYLLILINPIWLGEATGTFSKPPHEIEYSKLTTIFENDKKFSRIFWIPSKAPLGYFSLDHPSVEALRLVGERPFAIGTKGTYEILNFLREAPYMGEIFDVVGIGYIAYPPFDPRRDNLHPDNIKYYYTFSDQISRLPWVSKVENSKILTWETANHQNKFIVNSNIWAVLGSDNIYNEATTSSKLRLANNALIFTEEYPGLLDRVIKVPEAKIILNNKTLVDLAASFISSSQLIFPARLLVYDPDVSGWWKRDAKDLIEFRAFLKTKYDIDNQDFDFGEGWAIGEGSLNLKVVSSKLKQKEILLARVLESSRSGQIKFYQGNDLIGEVNTKVDGETNIRWFEVGQLPKAQDVLNISSSGDINIVNTLAVVNKSDWLNYLNKAHDLQNQGRIKEFNESQVNTQEGIVSYQQINPTKYIVTVSNLQDPGILIFSESYDLGWELNGNKSLPVYSLLNGFRIEKDGVYELTFKPQDWVYPGLAVSIATLFIIFIFLIWGKKKDLR